MLPKNPYWDPPSHNLYWEVRSDNADMEMQRNVLLHFLVENDLADDALAWLKINLPHIFRKDGDE